MASLPLKPILSAKWLWNLQRHLPWPRERMGPRALVYDRLDQGVEEEDSEFSPSPSSEEGTSEEGTSPDHTQARRFILEDKLIHRSHNRKISPVVSLDLVTSILIYVILGFVSYAILTGAFISNENRRIIPSRVSLGTCGKSPQEARTKGCVFDLFIGSFMHPQCFDQSLHDRYMREHNWTFYHDAEGLTEIPLEQVLAGEFEEIWMDGTFHYTHCAYVWEKHWRALEAGGAVVAMDSRARNGHHNKHCIDFIGAPNATYVAGRTSSHIHQHFGRVDCVVGPM